MKKKVLIAMSGGVDSSVTALLMQQAGYACVAVTMRLHPEVCGDIEAACAIADTLNIPFHECDLSDVFEREVIEPFIRGYEQGETPNPCVDCNRALKFGALLEIADRLDCDYLATGHYARIEHDDTTDRYLIRKATDPNKDQSYVLYTLSQSQLARLRLPLGMLTKAEVRDIAKQAGLACADKPDSQNICFVPDGDYPAFIERQRGHTYPEGDMLNTDGEVVGRHKGLIYYTLGQRKGLGAHGRPVYVSAIDIDANTITVTATNDDDALFDTRFLLRNPNWVAIDETPTQLLRCSLKIGYKHAEHPGAVQANQVTFDTPQRAITPGQAAVFYDGDYVLGGGTIDSVLE